MGASRFSRISKAIPAPQQAGDMSNIAARYHGVRALRHIKFFPDVTRYRASTQSGRRDRLSLTVKGKGVLDALDTPALQADGVRNDGLMYAALFPHSPQRGREKV